MINSVVTMGDGPQITVADIQGNPLWVPTKLKELMTNQFIAETLFRNAGGNTNGIVAYREGDPMFLIGDVETVAEGGEIPVSTTGVGTPQAAFASKRGLGVRVTKEMVDENQLDMVNRQMTGLRNTFIRANDRVAKTLLQSPSVPTIAVTTPWDAAGSTPRTDIARGIDAVTMAAPTVDQGGSEDEYFGFIPDTIVCHPGMRSTLLDNEQILKVYRGNVANESILYTGHLPETIYGLDVLQSYAFPRDKVLILQRGVSGFYSDTRALQFTPLYSEGGGPNGGPTETWRSDATQKRAMAMDQPKSAVWLTGLTTP